MRAITTKKLFAFILLVSGMFSITAINAQTCPPNKVWACRYTTNCIQECKCVNTNNVNHWLSQGYAACHCVYGCPIRLTEEGSDFENFISVYPNPGSNSAIISFALEQSQKVSLNAYDLTGKMIATLCNKLFAKGDHEITWNTSDVKAGIYFLRFEAANYSENQKLIVAK